jgi:hypothetical protein
MKFLLSFILLLSLLSTKAQQVYTIQANCKQTISLSSSGKDSAFLFGIVTAAEGVKSYLWTQTSGPNTSVIVTPGSTYTFVKNLVPGVYAFNFSAITNKGTSFAPIPDTLQVLPFVDKIDSIRIYYNSGKISIQK